MLPDGGRVPATGAGRQSASISGLEHALKVSGAKKSDAGEYRAIVDGQEIVATVVVKGGCVGVEVRSCACVRVCASVCARVGES